MRYLSTIIIFFVSLSGCDSKISQQETDKNGGDIIQTIFDMFQPKNKLPGKCSNLKRVHNIGELLNQVYEHVNDSCMYQASSKDLSDIWGVTVLKSSEFFKDHEKGNYLLELNKQKRKLSCTNRADPILVDIDNKEWGGYDAMTIYAGDCYKDKYGGFFETDPTLFSNKLPDPIIKESVIMPPPQKVGEPEIHAEPIPDDAKLKPNHYYYWLHPSGKGLVYFKTGWFGFRAYAIDVESNGNPENLY